MCREEPKTEHYDESCFLWPSSRPYYICSSLHEHSMTQLQFSYHMQNPHQSLDEPNDTHREYTETTYPDYVPKRLNDPKLEGPIFSHSPDRTLHDVQPHHRFSACPVFGVVASVASAESKVLSTYSVLCMQDVRH